VVLSCGFGSWIVCTANFSLLRSIFNVSARLRLTLFLVYDDSFLLREDSFLLREDSFLLREEHIDVPRGSLFDTRGAF